MAGALQSSRIVCALFLALTSLPLSARAAKEKEKEPERDPWASTWVGKTTKPLPPGVTHHIYHSESMKRDIGYCVYLPPQYEKEKSKRFPVIYELHGNGGTEMSHLAEAGLLNEAIAKGKCPPMIMVLPNGGLATMYNDSLDGTIMPDTAITKELIPLIDSTYRTIASREGRGIEGFSMGGHGAVKLAFEHPDLFSSLIGWAGGMQHIAERLKETDKYSPKMLSYLGTDQKKYEANDPFFLLRANADQIRGKMTIKLVCGTADDFHLKGTRELHELLNQLKIEHEYKEVPGVEHNQGKLRAPFGDTGFETHAKALAK